MGWHNPTRFVRYFGMSQLRYARALNPALILLVILAGWHFVRTGRWAIVALTLPTIIFNYLFWIPNAQPERHFLYMVPPLAILIGLYLGSIVTGARSFAWRGDVPLLAATIACLAAMVAALLWPGSFLLYLAVTPMLFIGLSPFARSLMQRRLLIGGLLLVAVVLAFVPSKYLLANPYSRAAPTKIAALADDIARLPPLDRPLIVITDGYPVAARLQAERMDHFRLDSLDGNWIRAHTDKNRIEMLIQSWSPDLAWEPLQVRARQGRAYYLIDRAVAPDIANRIATLSQISEIRAPQVGR
jgi:hypothetical protein